MISRFVLAFFFPIQFMDVEDKKEYKKTKEETKKQEMRRREAERGSIGKKH